MTTAVEVDESLRGARVALEEIPVIDFGPFLTGDLKDRRMVAEAIGMACRNIGFFYLANHGISDALVARTFAESKRFFELPMEAKLAIDIEKSGTRKEELLLPAAIIDRLYTLRRVLARMQTLDAMPLLIDRLMKTKNNAEFLDSFRVDE